jgi:hypothetical protein
MRGRDLFRDRRSGNRLLLLLSRYEGNQCNKFWTDIKFVPDKRRRKPGMSLPLSSSQTFSVRTVGLTSSHADMDTPTCGHPGVSRRPRQWGERAVLAVEQIVNKTLRVQDRYIFILFFS